MVIRTVITIVFIIVCVALSALVLLHDGPDHLPVYNGRTLVLQTLELHNTGVGMFSLPLLRGYAQYHASVPGSGDRFQRISIVSGKEIYLVWPVQCHCSHVPCDRDHCAGIAGDLSFHEKDTAPLASVFPDHSLYGCNYVLQPSSADCD